MGIKELWDAYEQDRSTENRNRVVDYYIPWTKRKARVFAKHTGWASDYDQSLSSCYFGLIDAVEGFDRTINDNFKSYAYFRLLGRVLDDMRRDDKMSRRGRLAWNQYEEASGNDLEKAEALGTTEDELHKEITREPWEVTSYYSEIEGRSSTGVLGLPQLLYEVLPEMSKEDDIDEYEAFVGVCLRILPASLRNVFILKWKYLMSYDEMSGILGRSKSNLVNSSCRAMKILREAKDDIAKSIGYVPTCFPEK